MPKTNRYRPKMALFSDKTKKTAMTKPESKNDRNFLIFSVEPGGIDVEKRTIDLSITSEMAVKRWWGQMVLGHNPGECRLDRVKTVGSFLFAHGRDPQYGVMPLGQILDVYLDEQNRKYRAKLKFDTDEKAELVWQKVQSGSLKGISVGVEFYAWLEVEAGGSARGFNGPISIAVDWEIFEISLEPTPAIPNVGVGLSLDEEAETEVSSHSQINELLKEQEGEIMKFKVTRDGVVVELSFSELTQEEKVQLGLIDKPKTDQTPEKTPEELKREERDRCLAIDKVCEQFGIDAAQKQKFISENFTIDGVNAFVLEKLATGQVTVKVPAGDGLQTDERDKFTAAVTDGLAVRAGIKIEKPAPGFGDFRGMSLTRLAEECYERKTGKRFKGSFESLMRLVFPNPGEIVVFESHSSSSDFPLILANVAHKSMAQAYAEAPTTYQLWVAFGTLVDFKQATTVRMSEASGLKPLRQHGEFEHAEVGEAATYRKLNTYGIKWSLTRVMIINDDLSAFNDLPRAYAQAARRDINQDAYEVLNANPTMDEDSKVLFVADHGNLAASGAVVSLDTLDAGFVAMAEQKNLKGEQYLNLMPVNLLIPNGKAMKARQIITSTVDITKNNQANNPYRDALNVISDPMLRYGAGGSATAWYLLASPNQAPTIQVDFLNGKDTPTMESQVSFDMLGIEYRMFHDWGVKAIDFRGAYKNPGA